MGNLLKRLSMSFSEDRLALASVLLAVSSILLMTLFGKAGYVLLDLMPFNDVVGHSSLVFEYLFDFSGVFSSIFLVVGIIGFVLTQMLAISTLLAARNVKSFLMLVGLIAVFYGWMSYLVPTVKNLENAYIGGGLVSSEVYKHNYNEAYGIVESEKLTELDRAYLNAQISAYKYVAHPDEQNKEILNADSLGLEIALLDTKNGEKLVNSNVVYKIYELSDNKAELPSMEAIVKGVKRSELISLILVIIVYLLVVVNIARYRREVGL